MMELSNTDLVFRQVAGLLRGLGLEARDQVDAISQLLVIQTLTGEWVESPDAIEVLELLRMAEKAALALEDQPCAELLVDPSAPFWKQLSPLVTRDALNEMVKTRLTTRGAWDLATDLVRWASDYAFSEISTPEELLLFMRSLLAEQDEVAYPFDSSAMAAFVGEFPDQIAISIRPRSLEAAVLFARACYIGGIQPQIELIDSAENDTCTPSSHVLLIPPFGGRVAQQASLDAPPLLGQAKAFSSEQAAILSSLSRNTKKMVALVPSGLLFRGGTGRRFREWLVREAGLTHVIEFPPGALGRTSIRSAILVLEPKFERNHVTFGYCDQEPFVERDRTGRIRVSGWQKLLWEIEEHSGSAEQSNDILAAIGKDEIARQDYVLHSARYLKGDADALTGLLRDRPTVPLSGVVEVIRPVPVKESKELKNPVELYEVLMSDFGPDNVIGEGSRARQLDPVSASKVERARLIPGDILIGVKGTIGKAAIVPASAPDNLLAGQTSVILRLPQNGPIRRPTYLLRYLCLPETIAYLDSHAGGSAVRFIKNRDLQGLPVPLPSSPDEEDMVHAAHRHIVDTIAKAKDLEQEARELAESAFDAVLSLDTEDAA